MTGLELPMVMTLVSGGIQAFSGIMEAIQGADAAKNEAKYATKIARMEADSQREEDRYAAARARARQYSGVVSTSGSPMFEDLENSRRIQQRWSDRIFQGRVSAFESKSRIPGIWLKGISEAAQGGLSIASGLYRRRAPVPSGASTPLFDDSPTAFTG